MTQPENTQLNGASLDIAEQRKHELKQLFPGVFTETRNDKGELVQSLDHARQHGRVTIGDMIRITGASRNTLKEHFKRLVEQGRLIRHGVGKATWYILS